ncbi:MAG: hypothetical protein HN657_07015 [Candidatus Marinimicrobia bacterium]|nr:hypothetical protein [Candidatus Neomarinimicrobiota bacterium]MBT3496616.1 hypothetical protein [Candidatus Neomarinimicrobiota bacterium]MBT3692924.1 hypothetical protein [Candidatus Neomarinimicrobiota bacterium]MBT3731696.1 hypothetical protein [Candidatus Neomarinimicrobiota bacterium]MBT4144800.1 hypothetical protein [Candidatus Neomarinimicrobiota bacterium]
MKKGILWFAIWCTCLSAQNIDMYLSLIHEGHMDAVVEQLPELMSKYPNNPDVWYVKALTTRNGNVAIEQYQAILKKFPESKFAHESAMKVGEYYFARGLYSQAARHLRRVPLKYSDSHHVQRAIDLLMNSYDATGESDSARYWLGYFKNVYPNLLGDVKENLAQKPKKISVKMLPQKTSVPKPYVVQIGAFGSISNAERLHLQASQVGYQVEIHTVQSNGNELNAVRIVRYISKKQAQKVGEEIKRKLGIDYRVLYRP